MPFGIPLWAELAAVGLGALQGALFAGALADRRIDVLGVVLIGIGVALGGSLLRDILLGEPPGRVPRRMVPPGRGGGGAPRDVTAAVVHPAPHRDPRRCDAVTIGLFGAIGTSKALALGVPAAPAVFVGAAAAVGGSVLRDLTLNLPVALLHVGSLYAVAAASGAVLLVVLVAVGVALLYAACAGVVLTTVIRLLAVRFGWSFPEQRALVV